MLRKVLTSSAAAAAVCQPVAAASSSSSSCAAIRAPGGLMRPTLSPLLMQQPRAVQNSWNNDNQNYAGRRSDYDFDKEAWAKQMKFASFDCIMEPSIIPPKYTSFEGIKKNIRRYLNMRKLTERRPGYSPADLQELFIRYKYLINSRNTHDSSTLLLRLTTHTEASRIEKDIVKRTNEDFKKKSWGSLKMELKKNKKVGGGNTTSAKGDHNNNNAADANGTTATNPSLAAAANNANDVVLMIKKPSHYDIHVTDFNMVTSYMASMAAEDWLQLTFKCEYYEKELVDGEVGVVTNNSSSSSAATSSSEDGSEKKAAAAGSLDKAALEKELADKGYKKVVEYPCFELRMGDGAAGGVQYPFIVLGVMRRDGTRFGRDAQDAATLRKQFDRNRSWFS